MNAINWREKMNKDTLGIKYHCLTLSCFLPTFLETPSDSPCRVEIYFITLPPAMVVVWGGPCEAASELKQGQGPPPGHPIPALRAISSRAVKPWTWVDGGLHWEWGKSAAGAHKAALWRERAKGKSQWGGEPGSSSGAGPCCPWRLVHLGRASILEYYKLHFKEQLKSPGKQVCLSVSPLLHSRYEVWGQNSVHSGVRSGLKSMLPEETWVKWDSPGDQPICTKGETTEQKSKHVYLVKRSAHLVFWNRRAKFAGGPLMEEGNIYENFQCPLLFCSCVTWVEFESVNSQRASISIEQG